MSDLSTRTREEINSLISNIESVIYIDRRKLEYIVASKIAGGHVILADSHGVGKTSLARALADSIEWDNMEANTSRLDPFNRIQCTVDLLPQDIIGFTRLSGSSSELSFNPGPIFAHFILCDEINLLTPKTQGSFFQAMEEQKVTIEGKTYSLPSPFFIIATMNLKGAHLFPLPAPQLDRFMIQISLGFPDEKDESEIVMKHGLTNSWENFKPVIKYTTLMKWQSLVDKLPIHKDVVKYIVACVRATRQHPDILQGASPRSGIKISRLVRALAVVRGIDYVSVDLVKEIFYNAIAHRLTLHDPEQSKKKTIESMLKTVPVDYK